MFDFYNQVLPSSYVFRVFVVLIGVFIPLWILPNSFSGLAAGAFCIQFGVQGAWGVVSNILYYSSACEDRAFTVLFRRKIDPHLAVGDVATRVPWYIPRCRVPTWQRSLSECFLLTSIEII